MNFKQLKEKYNKYTWIEHEDKLFQLALSKSKAKVYLLTNQKEVLYLKIDTLNNVLKEKNNLIFLKDKLPIPKLIDYYCSSKFSYLITLALPGINLKQFLSDQTVNNSIRIMAEGLKMIHSVSIVNANKSSKHIKEKSNKNDLVFIHGDYCPVNIIVNDNKLVGFIDFTESGIGDRYYDVAEAGVIIERHFNKQYAEMFYEIYDPNINLEKLDYYIEKFKEEN